MSRARPRPGSPTSPGPGRPFPRWTTEALAALGDRYPDWARALPTEDPVYAIPYEVIGGLALAHVFGERGLEAEREFSQVCRDQRIVGVWGPHTVAYHLLTRTPFRPDQLPLDHPVFRNSGWGPRELGLLQTATGRADAAADRLPGVVGWLLTEPSFLTERDGLRAEYLALPAEYRPSFPLGRVVVLDNPGENRTELPPTAAAFAGSLRRFLDRWGLTRLVTWDLPDPQGPLLPDPLPAGAPARPAHGVHLYVPIHYPLQGDDDLLRRVREFQRQQAIELGLAPGFGAIAHHAQYAQMFRLIHLDRAVRSRFAGRIPRGLVSAIEAAAAASLGISGESVRRLRNWVRICRAGQRATISRLRD
ncbi:MAG: hypothetical protein JWO38_5769 [Gemmataceae bacterium]|nr:hypothetical protein [Gemmataceae bacterium]